MDEGAREGRNGSAAGWRGDGAMSCATSLERAEMMAAVLRAGQRRDFAQVVAK